MPLKYFVFKFLFWFCTIAFPHVTAEDDNLLPKFSLEPLSFEQCRLQFTDFCRPWQHHYDYCTGFKGLAIRCSGPNISESQLSDIATAISQPPLRAVHVQLPDGAYITPFAMRPVQNQTVMIGVEDCVDAQVTKRLFHLRLHNLLQLRLENCYNLVLDKADFQWNHQIRIVRFTATTIASLEAGTFTDLPALSILSLEFFGLWAGDLTQEQKDYARRLHCTCEFAWFRRWLDAKPTLLRHVKTGEVIRIDESWENIESTRESMYFPVDCNQTEIPNPEHMDYDNQRQFSINEPACG
ncbi:uncharacterized protein LOC129600365 [Paramacrobiotus metropolitanus]|uniref:uncharacterized protein LOC129600365 n=1 Tax=Paramacrobiotus metropolitanus TaxID=2943436 RepID=UPI00244610BF|nr:uncharacterized protein LOC129600365 [Paramacrobiotus metropolitanus]